MTLGQRGEAATAYWLEQQGCVIQARNFRTRYGELDIVCTDVNYVRFVEVKTRSGVRYGTPAEAVTVSKQHKLILTAQQWLSEHPTELQPRFDVAEVFAVEADTTCRIHYIPNAFEVSE